MKPFRLRRVSWLATVGPLLALIGGLLLPGCKNFFVAKHKVLVDAISSPGAEKPVGKSYRLVAKRSIVAQASVQIPVVKACVDAALTSQGLFEPPQNVAPDYFIEVSYGRDSTPRVDPSSRETYLQLSARSNPGGSLDKATGPELWDVKVSVLGIAGAVETAMPLLSAVAANYLAGDTRIETVLHVPQNSPMIEAVRTVAIRALEAKNQPVSPPPNSATPSTPPPSAGGAGSSVAPGGDTSAKSPPATSTVP